MDQTTTPAPQTPENNQNQSIPPTAPTSPVQTQTVPTQPAQPKSSKNMMLIVIIIITLLILGAVLYMVKSSSIGKNAAGESDILSNITSTITPAAQEIPTVMPTTGNSDAQIEKDMNTTDGVLDEADIELQNVDAGLSDTPINLTE